MMPPLGNLAVMCSALVRVSLVLSTTIVEPVEFLIGTSGRRAPSLGIALEVVTDAETRGATRPWSTALPPAPPVVGGMPALPPSPVPDPLDPLDRRADARRACTAVPRVHPYRDSTRTVPLARRGARGATSSGGAAAPGVSDRQESTHP